MYTVGGLFSGVGGIEKGFERTEKFNVVWSNEIDKYACETYRLNHPDHNLFEKDINLLIKEFECGTINLESVDVLTGGFPCQAFSIAGHRKGFDDERGELFFRIMDLVDLLLKKPKVLFLENVKNFKTHDNGNTIKVVEHEIRKRGYSFFCEVINTSDVTTIPQNRERTFIVCFKDENRWNELIKDERNAGDVFQNLFPPKKIEKKKHVQDMLEKEKVDSRFYYTDRYKMYDKIKTSVTSKNTSYQWRRKYVRENKSNEFPTLTANMGTGGHNVPLIKDDFGIRKLTPKECFGLQGFSDIKLPDFSGDAQLYKQAGNMVTVDVIQLIAESIFKSLDYKYQDNVEYQFA
ncbi:MAG TPA: DNA (cytosine-5-)-methyltransferase [Balneola sp.]|nr:DNA (cytosine-5-)-methyltransferase [Balneola sp.]